MNETVTVDKFYFEQLVEESKLIPKLMRVGLQDWEGYEKALSVKDRGIEDPITLTISCKAYQKLLTDSKEAHI